MLATPLAAKAEQEPAKEAKDPSPAPVAQAAPAKAEKTNYQIQVLQWELYI